MRYFVSLVACIVLVSCGSDRSASGTTGTEAGNALAMRVDLPGRKPAAHAVVVARPFGSMDSSNASAWVRGVADGEGCLSLRLGEGDWTLEIRCGSFALVSNVRISGDTSLRDTLVGIRNLQGILLGAKVARVGVPGLGRSVPVHADGTFLMDSLPDQVLSLSIGGSEVRTIIVGSRSIAVSASGNDGLFENPVRVLVRGDGLASAYLVPDSLVPTSGAVLLDTLGRILPMMLGGVSNGERRLWSRIPVGTGNVFLCRLVVGNAGSDSVFHPQDGTRLEILPDLAPALSDLSRSGGAFVSSADPGVDSIWGPTLDASLGSSIGTIRAGLPDTGAFAVSFQARQLASGIESLWLLDWTDSLSSGLRVGVGGRRLKLVAPGIDTSIAWDPATAWFKLTVAWNGTDLVVATDGVERCHFAAKGTDMQDRNFWTRRLVGQGGGLRLSRLTIRAGRFDATLLSR